MMALVVIFYATEYWQNGNTISEFLIGASPFIMFGVLLLFFKNKTLSAILFLFIAIGTTVDPSNTSIIKSEISDYSGAIFFIFSFHVFKKKWYAYVLGLSSIACLTIRAIETEDTITGALIMVAVFSFIYAIYYFLIFKDSQPITIKYKGLTKQEKQLLILIANGHSQKTAGAQIGLTVSQTSELVKDIREKVGYDSLYQVLYHAGVNRKSITKVT